MKVVSFNESYKVLMGHSFTDGGFTLANPNPITFNMDYVPLHLSIIETTEPVSAIIISYLR